MIKIKADVFRISNGIKLCDLYISVADIDYVKAAETTIPTALRLLADSEDCPPLISVLNRMEGCTEKAVVNALSAFTDPAKDELFTAAALSFDGVINNIAREQDISVGTLSEFDEAAAGQYTLTLDFFSLERRSKICTANVLICTEDMKCINDYILSRITDKPSLLMKIGVGAANNSFVLGKLLKLYLPILNQSFRQFGIAAENPSVK